MKRLIRLLLGGVSSLALAACAPTARTSPVSGATLLGDGWRVIAGDKSEVTSDCIGQMTSPLCVVDTMMACDAWSPVRDYLPGEEVNSWHVAHPVCNALHSTPSAPDSVYWTFGHGTDNPKGYRLEYQVATFTVTAATLVGAPYFHFDSSAPPTWNDPRPGDIAAIAKWRWTGPGFDCLLSPPNKSGLRLYREDCRETASGFGDIPGAERAAILRKVGPNGEWGVVQGVDQFRDNIWPALQGIYGNTGWK